MKPYAGSGYSEVPICIVAIIILNALKNQVVAPHKLLVVAWFGAALAAIWGAFKGLGAFLAGSWDLLASLSGPAKRNGLASCSIWEDLVFHRDFRVNIDPAERARELCDLVPNDVDHDKVYRYLCYTWKTLSDILEETTLPIMNKHGLTRLGTLVKQNPTSISVTSLGAHASEFKGTITITDVLQHQSTADGTRKDKHYFPIRISLHITQYEVQAANCHYPYDITPVLTKRDSSPCAEQKTEIAPTPVA